MFKLLGEGKKEEMQKKSKWFWTLFFLNNICWVIFLTFWFYEPNNKITINDFSDVDLSLIVKEEQSTAALFEQDKEEYLIYVHPSECGTCADYLSTLSNYRQTENALPLFVVQSGKVTEELEQELYVNLSQPEMIHVKDNTEIKRLVGEFKLDQLPYLTE